MVQAYHRTAIAVIVAALAACGHKDSSPPVASAPAVIANSAVADASVSAVGISIVGRWRVVGCATSPGDPADCARGEIVFEAHKWSVALGCCKRAAAYTVVSTAADRVTISSDGEQSEIRIGADGRATWNPHLDGRVGTLSFVRVP